MEKLTRTTAEHIARRMRGRDVVEVAATTPDFDPVEWAWMLSEVPGEHVIWRAADSEPVAMGGMHRTSRVAASSWFVATDRIDEVAVAVNCGMIDLHRRWSDLGIKRFFCLPVSPTRKARRWMAWLGYHKEGEHALAGVNGETVQTWACLDVHTACWKRERRPCVA